MKSFTAAAVIGSNGMLGADLCAALQADGGFGSVAGADFPEIDITKPGSVSAFLRASHAEVVFNCAAFTDVDGCEFKSDVAFAVNADGAGNVAAAAQEFNARIIHMGTDYVFDGAKRTPYTEEDPTNPLSSYGESKLAGERLVAQFAEDWIIARTGWLYGKRRENVVDKVLKLALSGVELKGPTDLFGSPTWTKDLCGALIALAKSEAQGIFHTVNGGGCSRYEQVQAIAAAAGVQRPVTPVSAADFPRPARIPAYSILSTDKLTRATGHSMRPWKEAIEQYVTEVRKT